MSAITPHADVEPPLGDEELAAYDADAARRATTDALEFGRFSVLLRQRQLVADGVPVPLGTRAFDLLLVLLEADGALVSKDELFSRVWPDVTVAEENLKVQITAVRKALGEDRDLIRTEFSRGYRFTGTVGRTVASRAYRDPALRRRDTSQRCVTGWISWPPPQGRSARDYSGRPFAAVCAQRAAACRDRIGSAVRKAEGQ